MNWNLAASSALSLGIATAIAIVGCGSSDDSATPSEASDTDASSAGTDSAANTDGQASSDASSGSSACATAWAGLSTLYPAATNLTSCTGTSGEAIAASLMNLSGITIDNAGTQMTPCVEAKCDSTYVYIASNAIPHYDFVATTPNALVYAPFLYRIPITPSALSAPASAVASSTITGCSTAYTNYVAGNAGTESSDPSGECGSGYFYDDLANGTRAYYSKLSCAGTTGFVIDGVPTYGPNEAKVPDPWGDPVYYWPSLAGETYVAGAALDLCGGHTSPASMHYHGAIDACFAKNASGGPANTYDSVAESWDFAKTLTDDCTTESPIVGYSFDGYPIRGTCICTERNTDGTCKTVKKARSSWVYAGLGAWGDPTASDLGNEGKSCTQTSDCCASSGTCKYKCSHAVFDDSTAPGGSVADQRCVLLDYSYCTHEFKDRTEADVSATNFVYLDRCNGYEGPDGYSYYGITSFPYLTGCMHGDSATLNGGTVGSGGGAGGPPGGGAGGDGGPPGGGM